MAALFVLVASAGDLSADGVRDWVDDAGVWAPVTFVVVSASLTVAFFPGPLLAGASGLLFGTAAGFPLSLCAAVLGASAAFLIARHVGRDAATRLAGPRVLAVRDAVSRRGFLAILYARILPGVPYNLVNYGAGLTTIPLAAFAGATALGAAPRAFAYTALGGSLDDLGSPEAIVAIAVLVVMAVGGVVAFRRSGSARQPHEADGAAAGDEDGGRAAAGPGGGLEPRVRRGG